jgi:hypothetical protein
VLKAKIVGGFVKSQQQQHIGEDSTLDELKPLLT